MSSLDKVVLYKILDIDFTLANVFMRTNSKINKFIKSNTKLMDKITHHFQSKIKREIDNDLKVFFGCEDAGFNFKNNTTFKQIKPPIKNIAIKQFNNKKKLYSKTTQIFLVDLHGRPLKTLSTNELIKKIELQEYQNLLWLIKKNCDLYRLSKNAHHISPKYIESISSLKKQGKKETENNVVDLNLNLLGLIKTNNNNKKVESDDMELIESVDALLQFIYTYEQQEKTLKNNSEKLLVPITVGFFITFVLGHWGRS